MDLSLKRTQLIANNQITDNLSNVFDAYKQELLAIYQLNKAAED
jgi:histidyl-tRNA synthetase